MKFKCNHTGQVYTFTDEHDIESMLVHDEYTPVVEQEVAPVVSEVAPVVVKATTPKKAK